MPTIDTAYLPLAVAQRLVLDPDLPDMMRHDLRCEVDLREQAANGINSDTPIDALLVVAAPYDTPDSTLIEILTAGHGRSADHRSRIINAVCRQRQPRHRAFVDALIELTVTFLDPDDDWATRITLLPVVLRALNERGTEQLFVTALNRQIPNAITHLWLAVPNYAKLTPRAVQIIAEHTDTASNQQLIRYAGYPRTVRDEAIEQALIEGNAHYVLRDVADDPDLSGEQIARIYDRLATFAPADWIASIAGNRSCPPELLDTLARHTSTKVRLAAVSNPNTPMPTLVEISQRKPSAIVDAAAENLAARQR